MIIIINVLYNVILHQVGHFAHSCTRMHGQQNIKFRKDTSCNAQQFTKDRSFMLFRGRGEMLFIVLTIQNTQIS